MWHLKQINLTLRLQVLTPHSSLTYLFFSFSLALWLSSLLQFLFFIFLILPFGTLTHLFSSDATHAQPSFPLCFYLVVSIYYACLLSKHDCRLKSHILAVIPIQNRNRTEKAESGTHARQTPTPGRRRATLRGNTTPAQTST